MASEITVQTIRGPASGTNANKILIPAGQTLDASSGFIPPAGSVIQVIQTVKTDSMAASPGALWADVPGQGGVGVFSATITPSSTSSRILIIVDIGGAGTTDSSIIRTRLVRGSTPIYFGDAVGNRPQSMSQFYVASAAAAHYIAQLGGTFLDSPATTGSTTYKVQFGADGDGNTVYIGRTQADRNAAVYDSRVPASIILMEIAG